MKKTKIDFNFLSADTTYNLAFILTTVTIIAWALILSFLSEAPVDWISIENNYALSLEDFKQEKTEKLMYLTSLVLFPLLFVLYSRLTKRLNADIGFKYAWIAIIPLASWVFSYNHYRCTSSLYKRPLLLIFTFLSLLFILERMRMKKQPENKIYNISLDILLPCIVILFVVYLHIMTSYKYTNSSLFHAEAYYYPAMKILNGLTPGIDFSTNYGFYCYPLAALVWFVSLFTGDNILSFSIITASLIGCCLYFLYKFISHSVSNKIIKNIIFILITYYSVCYLLTKTGLPYLQYTPNRLLFPALYLFLLTIYTKTEKSKKSIIATIIYVALGLGVLWNVEMGLVALITHFGVRMYELICEYKINEKPFWKGALVNILSVVGSLLFAVLLLIFVGYVRTGEIISISYALTSQSTFYGTGYYMIKMPLGHPWILAILIYMTALAGALRKTTLASVSNESIKVTQKDIFKFALSILGLGIFVYYQGRSRNDTFSLIAYPGIILLGIYLE